MKHITIGEINKFQCIGSKCPYTCCANWGSIYVDKETDEYYQSVAGAFGEELKENIDRSKEAATLKTRNGRCAFLNEKNLCRIYIELGPEHMCDICQTYPRFERTTGNLIWHSMTMSCPEVGRILLSRKAPLKLRVMEDDGIPQWDAGFTPDWNFFQCAARAFEASLAILQNRLYSVAERERAFLLFNRSLQNALDAGNMAEAEALIAHFSAPANYASLAQSKLSAHLPSKVRLFRELCALFLIRNTGSPMFQMFIRSVDYIKSEDADMDALCGMFKTLDGDSFQREQESLLTYLLFNHYLSNDLLDKKAKRNLFGDAVFILTMFQFYRIFSAVFSVTDGKVLNLTDRTLMLSLLSRGFEHNQEFRKNFYAELEKHDFYDLGFLFQLIS